MARRVRPQDLLPSEEEKRLARELAATEGYGAIGGSIGGALGTAGFLGDAALGGASGGAIGAASTAIGGAAGSWIGSLIGDAQAKGLEERMRPLAERRARIATREEMRRAALRALVNREAP